MVETDKASSRPWRVMLFDDGYTIVRCDDEYNRMPVKCSGKNKTANATLTVRAVNSFDAFMKAARLNMAIMHKLRDRFDGYDKIIKLLGASWSDAWDATRDALELAKKEAEQCNP